MSEELVTRAEAVAARAYAPYSNYLVGAVVRATTAGSSRASTSRTPPIRSASAQRRARSSRPSPPATAPAGSPRSGSTRPRAAAAASGCTSSGSPRSASGARTARSPRTRRPSCCPTPGSSRTREVRLHRGRRPAERRQVDARERARRGEGGDRLGAEHDAAPVFGVANGDDWQLVLVDLPGFQKPMDKLTERMQQTVDYVVRGHRRRPLRPLCARPRRRRRPLHRPARLRARQACDRRREQGRQPEAEPHHRRR